MKIKQWNKQKWESFIESIQSHWKLNQIHTQTPFQHHVLLPYYIGNTSPICTKIIRKLYRIQTYGFICKVMLETPRRKPIYTKSFIKELSLASKKDSPDIELYATMCASYLRHTRKTPGLALCYGFVSGIIDTFTVDIHTSSAIQTSLPIRNVGETYTQVERTDEPIYLLMQEYFPLSFDDVMDEWKTLNDTVASKHLSSMLYQIASGLHTMETEWGIYHNDLHLGNIMARKQSNGTYQWFIIDWGRSTLQRKGCQRMNQIFKSGFGPAYGQFKMNDFPLEPNSTLQYSQATSCGDLICLLISLLQEPYVKQLLHLIPIPSVWFPQPPIRGNGLHCFRLANKWAANHSSQLSMKSFIDTMTPYATQQTPVQNEL